MSKIACDSCTELREFAPEFVQNGVTTNIATSLQNNTGLNPSLTVTHSDCEDLNTVNDCLVGRMGDEIEAYDVCDWKDFMKNFIGNLYETLKAMIAAICGLWTKTDSLCELLNAVIAPPYSIYGILPNDYGDDHPERRGGVIGEFEGKPYAYPVPDEEVPDHSSATWRNAVFGIRYATVTVTDCDGVRTRYEWIVPRIYTFYLNDNPKNGDILWSFDHDTARRWGISENLWDNWTSHTWGSVFLLRNSSDRRNVVLTLARNKNTDTMDLIFHGTSYPNTGLTAASEVWNPANEGRLWTSRV